MILKFLNDDFNSIERFFSNAIKPYVEQNEQKWISDMVLYFGNYQDALKYVCCSIVSIEMEFGIIPIEFKGVY